VPSPEPTAETRSLSQTLLEKFGSTAGILVAFIAVAIGTYVLLITIGTAQEAKFEEPKLAHGGFARHPVGVPSKGFRLFIFDMKGRSWLLSAEGTPTNISFRQSATVFLRLRPARDEDETPSPREIAVQELDKAEVVCVGIGANAFEITGPDESCTSLAERRTTHSWAWSLEPRGTAAGPQSVAVSLVVRSRSGVADAAPTRYGSVHQTRFFTIDVERGFFDRYATYITALIAALTTLGVALITYFKEVRGRSEKRIGSGP